MVAWEPTKSIPKWYKDMDTRLGSVSVRIKEIVHGKHTAQGRHKELGA